MLHQATRLIGTALIIALFAAKTNSTSMAQEPRALILPEQRALEIRSPEQMRITPLPTLPTPATVAQQLPVNADRPISLDEAIRIALDNCRVVRTVLGGTTTANNSNASDSSVFGLRTIYDPAITNTQIDVQRGRFDPVLQNSTTQTKTDLPTGVLNVAPPPTTIIQGAQTDAFNNTTTLSKQFLTGATAQANVNVNRLDDRSLLLPLGLNPQTRTTTDLAITQPLLQGAGYRANIAPIVIARINTERSFFQMKDSVQQLLQSVILTYWNMQQAQADIWVRKQQVAQGKETLERAEARFKVGLGNFESDVAQARVSYENFRAALVVAEGNLLQQEGVLRNLLGIPPSDGYRLVPTTPLNTAKIPADWPALQSLAEVNRPDLIELKLIIEADEQQLLLARNQAQPRLDAVGLYRWNGLDGHTPDGTMLSASGRDYQEWQVGVNFSVPLGLRSSRAGLRQWELILARDRANLEQGLHSANHSLATSYRDLARSYEQYLALKRTREAAYNNVERQLAAFLANTRVLYLNVLQAITDWGNAVSAETQSLVQYNTALTNLELQTGTILESHGVRFAEERYGSIGPAGKHFKPVCYPQSISPTENLDRPRATGADAYKLPENLPIPGVEQLDRPVPMVNPPPANIQRQPNPTPSQNSNPPGNNQQNNTTNLPILFPGPPLQVR